jgi:outer membrane protein assembly factor BamB
MKNFIIFNILFALVASDVFENNHWGHSLKNTNYFVEENIIGRHNVGSLQIFCAFNLSGPWETAEITVKDDIMYFGDFGGYIYAVYVNCTLKWKIFLPNITGKYGSLQPNLGYSGSMTRNSIAIKDGLGIFGDYNGGTIFAINIDNGQVVWNKTISYHPFARIAQSATIYNGRVIVGTASV